MTDATKDDQRRKIESHVAELTAIRRDIHQHPEMAYEENRTADIVAKNLEKWGLEVHRGFGGTGVVGTLRRGDSNRAVGLRADMDALYIQEKTPSITNRFMMARCTPVGMTVTPRCCWVPHAS